jgi:MFS family permease
VLTIQALSSFIGGAFGVALPLMMKEREVSIVVVGFVFAAMPLIMQFGRVVFATLSDFWGRKVFFVSSGFLAAVSGLIFFVAHTPLEYLFGKVAEGAKEGTLWAVNRAFLLEESRGQWKVLVHLRTVAYLAYAVGSFLAGFLVAWFFFEGTMLLCAFFGALVVLVSLALTSPKKEHLRVSKALRFLDLRKKDKTFRVFLVLFCFMGVSYGLVGGFVITWFLSFNGFNPETIGLIFGVQILLAGLFSYLFSRTMRTKQSILVSGFLFSAVFLFLGFSSPVLAGVLILVYGGVQGVDGVVQEIIHTNICSKESYATDIGLLWTGFHIAESVSLVLTGYLISVWSFVAPFLLAALMHIVFSVGAYRSLK